MPTSPEWKMAKYDRLKAASLCPSCGKARDSEYLHCATCLEHYRKASAKWKAKQHPDSEKDRALRKKYGISRGEWLAILASQDGRCAICHTDKPVRGWTVDHCHSSGIVRSILCHPCNVGLGQFLDNPDLLDKAAQYLRRHKLTLVG